jgi:type IV secretion system protein VirB5
MRKLKKAPDHVPGPAEEAALRVYFERGSKSAIEASWWKILGVVSMAVVALQSAGLIYMITTKEVHVIQVTKNDSGELQASGVASKFTPDEDSQMAWASSFASDLTEITPAIWQRNVERVQRRAVGTSIDQVKSYLQKPENNPPQQLARYPTYVREYVRRSVNKVADMTFLIRYELVSRSAPSVPPQTKSYAMTVTLAVIGHKTQDDVFRNPEGLAVTNFSISEDFR